MNFSFAVAWITRDTWKRLVIKYLPEINISKIVV